MLHIIFVAQDDEEVAMSRPVREADAAYFRRAILPHLQPLSEEDYTFGPAAILHTMARFCYILDGPQLYWCIEWDPGLLVIRFSPDGSMAYAAAKSPNPSFGGRRATEQEIADFDDEAENPQYNLIFDAWDAQFSESDREGFVPIDPDDHARYLAAIEPVNARGERMEQQFSEPEAYKAWRAKCKESAIWIGDRATS